MSSIATAVTVAQRGGGHGVLRRAGAIVAYAVVPAVALLAVIAYVLGATVGHANPPVVPVQGVSMRPTLQAGDLIVLKGVDPKTLHKGDIVAVDVPKSARDQYGLPGQIVHRIVRIAHDQGGLFFVTKGDANSGADVFQTRPGDVVGKLALRIPAGGYPFLFFRSRQGEIFLAVALVAAVLYFVLGLFEERRAYVEGTVLTMQTVLEETQELKQTITTAERFADQGALERLADEVRVSTVRNEESQETVRALVAAVSEYGEHLRSHTAVMKNLAAATAELTRATGEMRESVARGPAAGPFVPRVPLATGGELDRTLAETAARLEEASRRREELRRALETRSL